MTTVSPGTAEDLVRARAVLLGAGPGQRRLGAEALRAALVDLHDLWLSSRAVSLGMAGGDGTGIALVAVGGLGRRELAPYSDLDLVLVHDGGGDARGNDIAALAEQLWYPLWDAGVGLDHSVRTVGQAVAVAATDLRAAMGLLEVRHLAGDGALTDRLIGAVRQTWRSSIRTRFDELVGAAEQRWLRTGEVAHRVEPDLKSGHGGLRDVQLLDALATAQLVDRAGANVRAARTLLLDVRTELHRNAGRGRDVLRAQDADDIAAAVGVADRFELARELSGAARTVVFALDVALRGARAALPRRGLAALRRVPVRRPLDEGVVEHGGEVVLARDAHASRDPALVLRVAAAAARTGLPVAAGTLARLADTAPELREPWPIAARSELLSLLGSGRGMVGVVEALDRTGLWGRLFPEWGAVRDLPPRDRSHVWTVDRHLVETCAQATRLTTRVTRPDLLLLGALLHDAGKGRGTDHSEVGASLARQVGRRLGLWPHDVELLARVVRHHLLLPHTATRRDPEDPATVQRVVDTLAGDAVLLELLAALAEADGLATGPGVWSDWRSTLVDGLVARCRVVMSGGPMPEPDPLSDAQRELAVAVAASGRPEVLVAAEPVPATVTVAAPDRPGLLSRAAGVLALHSLQVHAAALRGDAGVVVDTFTVSPRFGSLPDAALLREDLVRALEGTLRLDERLAAKERDYGRPAPVPSPARVLWFDDEASGAAVLELRGADRIGLLHQLAAALEGCHVDLRWAKVVTLGTSVLDSFCLTGTGPDGSLSAAARQGIEQAVLAAAR